VGSWQWRAKLQCDPALPCLPLQGCWPSLVLAFHSCCANEGRDDKRERLTKGNYEQDLTSRSAGWVNGLSTFRQQRLGANPTAAMHADHPSTHEIYWESRTRDAQENDRRIPEQAAVKQGRRVTGLQLALWTTTNAPINTASKALVLPVYCWHCNSSWQARDSSTTGRLAGLTATPWTRRADDRVAMVLDFWG
jgi:hypothetical protein